MYTRQKDGSWIKEMEMNLSLSRIVHSLLLSFRILSYSPALTCLYLVPLAHQKWINSITNVWWLMREGCIHTYNSFDAVFSSLLVLHCPLVKVLSIHLWNVVYEQIHCGKWRSIYSFCLSSFSSMGSIIEESIFLSSFANSLFPSRNSRLSG